MVGVALYRCHRGGAGTLVPPRASAARGLCSSLALGVAPVPSPQPRRRCCRTIAAVSSSTRSRTRAVSNARGNTEGSHQAQPPRAPALRSAAIGWGFASRRRVAAAAWWLRPARVGTAGTPRSRRRPPCHRWRVLPPGRGGLPRCGDADIDVGGLSRKPCRPPELGRLRETVCRAPGPGHTPLAPVPSSLGSPRATAKSDARRLCGGGACVGSRPALARSASVAWCTSSWPSSNTSQSAWRAAATGSVGDGGTASGSVRSGSTGAGAADVPSRQPHRRPRW